MAKRPLAQRHLVRLHELVTTASICRVVMDRELVESELISRAAATDRSIDEEVVALARDRGWALPEAKPYQWQMMATYSDPLPRVFRVASRDLFELDGMCRETDDGDVAALAAQLRSERRDLLQALEREAPHLSLPGAK